MMLLYPNDSSINRYVNTRISNTHWELVVCRLKLHQMLRLMEQWPPFEYQMLEDNQTSALLPCGLHVI